MVPVVSTAAPLDDLEAEGPDAAAFRWTVDEQPVANSAGLSLWRLAAGHHIARVAAATSHAEVNFTVRP